MLDSEGEEVLDPRQSRNVLFLGTLSIVSDQIGVFFFLDFFVYSKNSMPFYFLHI